MPRVRVRRAGKAPAAQVPEEAPKRVRVRKKGPSSRRDDEDTGAEPVRAEKQQVDADVDLSSKMSEVIPALPLRRVFTHNKDKSDHIYWDGRKDICSWPSPARFIICGRPNSGKTAWCHEIIARASPPYDQVVVVHGDPESLDYADYDPVIRTTIPEINEGVFGKYMLDPDTGKRRRMRSICICDDIEFGSLGKEQKQALVSLMSYTSTHKHTTCILSTQDVFRIHPDARRMANVFILYRSLDLNSMKQVASRIGWDVKDFIKLFDKHVKGNHDCLIFDLTDDTPAPLRLNGFEVLDEKFTSC